MADMTNEELKKHLDELATQQKGGSNIDTAIDDLFNSLESRASLNDLDIETLEKFFYLAEGRPLNDRQNAVFAKVMARHSELKEQLAQTQQPTATGTENTKSGPQTTATPQPKENKTSEFDGMSSYDLLVTYGSLKHSAEEFAKMNVAIDNTVGEPKDKVLSDRFNKVLQGMEHIEDYVKDELAKIKLDVNNAPMVQDYVQIMSLSDKQYKYEKAEELQQKLAEYDKLNGLDGDLPSAAEANANQAKWKELTKDIDTKELTDIPVIQALQNADKQTADELIEILKTTALTQMITKKPSGNQAEDLQAYKEVLNKVSAQYAVSLEESARMFPLSDSDDYLKAKFLTDMKLSKEEFDAGMQDENKKKHLETALNGYMEAQKQRYKKNLDDYLKLNNLTREDWDKADKDSPIRKGFEKYNIVTPAKTLNAVYTQGNTVYAARLARKTRMPQTPREAAALQKDMTKKNSAFMGIAGTFLKNAGTSLAIGAAFGTVGLTAKQGWDLYKDLKKSWKKFEEQSNGKASKWNIKNWKNFRQYLHDNPDERMNLRQKAISFSVSLAASAAIVSAVGLTGGLGLAGGAVANITGAAAQNAATATTQILGQNIAITKLKGIASGTVAAGFGAARYLNARKEARPLERELLAILSRQEGLGNAPQKKGLWARLTTKDPAKQIMNKLTANLFNDEAKMDKVIADLQLSAKDKERVKELAVKLKQINGKAKTAGLGAALGAAGGLFVAEDGTQRMAEFFGNTPAPESTIDPLAESAQVGAAVGTEIAQEATPESAVENPVTEIEVPMQTMDAAEFERGGDMWYITQRGPTVVYEDFEKNGWLTSEEIETLKAGKKYITSDDMSEYLQTKQYTPEQLQEIRDYASKSNRDYFETRVKEVNDRDGWHDPSEVRSGGNANAGGNGNANSDGSGNTAGNATSGKTDGYANDGIQSYEGKEGGGNGNTAAGGNNGATAAEGAAAAKKTVKVAEVSGKAEEGGWLKRILHKKHDVSVNMPVSGDLDKDVENYAARVAMQSKGMPINPESNEALKKDGYTVSGHMTDTDGKTHDFKVKVKGKDDYTIVNRTVDDVRSKAYVLKDGSKVEYLEGQKAAADYVGDANGTKADVVLGSIRNANGTSVTYIRDGDTKDIYMKSSDGDGNDMVSKTTFSKKDVMKIMKENRTRH